MLIGKNFKGPINIKLPEDDESILTFLTSALAGTYHGSPR